MRKVTIGGQEIRKWGKLRRGIAQLKLKGVQYRTDEKLGRPKVQLSLKHTSSNLKI
jgi:hypothetical protein